MSIRTLATTAALLLLVASCADDEPVTGTTTAVEDSRPGDTTTDGSTTDGTSAEPTTPVLTEVATGLGALTDLAVHPGTGHLYLAEQEGVVVQVDPVSGDVVGEVVDISERVTAGGEQGLLGIAIDPTGEHLYLSYSGPDGETRLDELVLDADGAVTDDAARTVLTEPQPYANHNGGDIAFGPDGYLYLALGDGGAGGDPHDTGQDPSDLLGSILRIDPSEPGEGDRGYAIPDDNPFAGGGGAPEVWLYGARNPWRFSWDASTGDLWVADVGQGAWEEIDHLPAPDAGRGANLGWNEVEGLEPFDGGTKPDGAVDPIHVYGRDGGACSVTGGFVYRGDAIDSLAGVYLFGDFCLGQLQGLQLDPDSGEPTVLDLGLEVEPAQLSSFGEGAGGEIYVLTLGGTLHRIDAG